MKKIGLLICVCILMFSGTLYARPTVAFGYLTNKSGNPNFNYMEIIFPNSFASSIEAVYDCTVIKPLKLNELLEKKQLKLEKHYENHELPQIAKTIDCDLFIFGYFLPLADNTIKIVLTLYESGSNQIFTFTNIGRMETEIFKIIDRITLVVFDFFGKDGFFMSKPIVRGSSVGLITNLNPEELNVVYAEFFNAGYSVSAIQGNEIDSYYAHESEIMNYFQYISTDANSYDIITDWSKFKMTLGTWESKKKKEWQEDLKKIYEMYDLNYKVLKNTVLEKYKNIYPACDYLIIAVFDSSRSSCWVRAIDIKTKQLIFMHSNVAATGINRDLQKTTHQLITIMQTPTALPQKTKKK
ncbi:MAG: hypothetical protein N3F66_06095 [Spirochaetes bacterium]|nr:hypothetical protein [Spirochaetota bacterium]